MEYVVFLKVIVNGFTILEDPIHVFDSLKEAERWCTGKDYFVIRVYEDENDYDYSAELDCFGDPIE